MITVNLDKAKTISHDIRRQKRSEEFEPLDNLVMKQIPGTDLAAIEIQRQAIRDKYAEVQTNIDATTDTDALLVILNGITQ